MYVVGKTEMISYNSMYLMESQLFTWSDNCTAIAKQGNNFIIYRQLHALNVDVISTHTCNSY